MADDQDLTMTEEEETKETVEPVESWTDEPSQGADSFEAPSAFLSSPETAPSVTPDRKNELLIKARADRIAWIQAVPLPYRTSGPSSADTNIPWSQDDRLALLKASNAVQSLSSIPDVISSLYGMEATMTTEVADRIQALLEPLGLSQEDCELATVASRRNTLLAELFSARTEQQHLLLESYSVFLTKLQTPECATMVQGMRTFVRTLPDTQEAMASSLRSYLTSTFESMKSHGWSNVHDGVRHSLESFLYGQCQDRVQSVLEEEVKEDIDFLERLESLQFVTPAHLEVACLVDENVDELLQVAIDTLASVDSYFSPYEKLQQILKVYHGVNSALSKALNKDSSSSQKLPSADDVLPTLILTVLRSKPAHLVSNLRMIEVFCPPEYLRGEAGYAYTNLYGAFQFLRDINLENPESLSINHDDFRKGLEEGRASAKAHLVQVIEKEEKEAVTEKVAPSFPVEIPVHDIRAARLRGEIVDLEWAMRWQTEHGVAPLTEVIAPAERSDGPPSSLPSGFSRSYSFMVTRPEDVRISELPQLLAEYRMLVHTTEQLIAERTARLSAERKQKLKAARDALLVDAAKADMLPTGKRRQAAPAMAFHSPAHLKRARLEEARVKGENNSIGIPSDAGPFLRKCIHRWGLLPPYSNVNYDQAWGKYYHERALLDFRRSHFWQEDGEQFPTFSTCFQRNVVAGLWEDPCNTAMDTVEDGMKICHCGKALQKVVDVPENVVAAWRHETLFDTALPNGSDLPDMIPHCHESRAYLNHESKSTKGQYTDFLAAIQKRVEATLASTNIANSKQVARTAAKGVYILSYWVNFDESGINKDARTVEVSTRFYSPYGNGQSLDLLWHRHSYGTVVLRLYAQSRDLQSCKPEAPTHTLDLHEVERERSAWLLALASGYIDSHIKKEFATRRQLKNLATTFLGEEPANALSAQKIFGLFARAAGVYSVAKAGGWVFKGMRKRYELYPGEDSDAEEQPNSNYFKY